MGKATPYKFGDVMRLKSLLAALIAVAMISVPFAAVVGVQDVYADDGEDAGVKVGDAWGFSATLDSFDDFEEFGESLEEILGEFFGEEGEEFSLLDFIMDILSPDEYADEDDGEGEGSDFDELLSEEDLEIILDIFEKLATLKFNIVIAGIIEVTQADENGYTVSVDAGVSADVSLKVDINSLEKMYEEIAEMIPEEGEGDYSEIWETIEHILEMAPDYIGDGKLFVKLDLLLALMLSGTVMYDSDWELKNADISTDLVGTVGLETNVDIVGTIFEFIFNEDDSSLPTSLLQYLDDGERDVYSVTVGLSFDNTVYTVGDSVLDTVVMGITVDAEAPVSLLVALKFILEIPNEIYRTGSNLQFSLADANVSYEYGYDEAIPLLYIVDEAIYLTVIKADEADDADGDKSVLFLEGPDKTAVRNDFKKVKNTYNGMVSKVGPSNVTLYGLEYDEEEDEFEFVVSEKIEVPFNKRMTNLPVLDNLVLGEEDEYVEYKHVGWGCINTEPGDVVEYDDYEDMTIWNPAWKVKGDLKLYPIYAYVYEDLEDTLGYLSSIFYFDLVYVKVDINELDDVGLDFESGALLYIDVYDGDKFLYTWKIGSPNGIWGGEITNFRIGVLNEGDLFNEAKKELDGSVLFLNFSSSGTTPFGTTVSYNVEGVFSDGTELYVYLVLENEEGKFLGLEPMGIYVVDGNTVLFNVPHCSVYALSAIPQSSSSDGGLSTSVYAIVAVVAILLVAGVAYVMFSRRG